MNIFYQKKFLKDLARIPLPIRKEVEKFSFNDLLLIKKFNELENIGSMTGYPHYYKKRFGDYRLGFHFEKDIITLERVLHRKEIYRFFP